MSKFNLKSSKTFSKENKSSKKQSVEKPIVEKPKIQKHDVIFDVDYLGTLTYDINKYNNIPTYLNKFFFRYKTDIFFDTGLTFELLSINEAKNRIPKEYMVKLVNNEGKVKNISLRDYFESKLFLKTPDTKVNIDYKQPVKYVQTDYVRGFEVPYNYLNFKKELPVDYTQVIKETEDLTESVDMFFKHIKEVICSNNEYDYDIVCKFFASCCAGHKVKFCLYLEDMKNQTGKGTIINKMLEILGERAHKTSSIEQVETYTKKMEGRCLINLDEIPVNVVSKTFQDKMKGLITEDYFDCREMHQTPYSQRNTFNIILTSNNSSISLTQTNQNRYFMPTISDKYQDNLEYFKTLHKKINRKEVNILIFQRFIKIYEEEIKPINWIGNCLKQTDAVIAKSINALPPFIKWLKTTFLHNREGIDSQCNEFFLDYKMQSNDKTSENKLAVYLKDLNVIIKRIGGTSKRKYVVSYEHLLESFYKKNWLDKTTDYELIEEYETTINKPVGPVVELKVDEDDELERLEKELENLI